jgi:hypothetical protein
VARTLVPAVTRAIEAPRDVKGSFRFLSGLVVGGGWRQDTDWPQLGKLLVGQRAPADEIGVNGWRPVGSSF